jgi:aryl-alcohol dehydrogenase-like predicted oxidoreductase
MEQLEDALRAAKLKLEPTTIQAIEEIWPGPGGEAPEAYAW